MNIDNGLIRHWAMLFESGCGISEDGKCQDGLDGKADAGPKTPTRENVGERKGLTDESRSDGFMVVLLYNDTGKVERKVVRAKTEEEAREYAEKNLMDDDSVEIGEIVPLDDLNMNILEFKKDCARIYDQLGPLQTKLGNYLEMLEALGKKVPPDLDAYRRFFDVADEIFAGTEKKWHGTYSGSLYGMDGTFGKRKSEDDEQN